MDEPLIRSTTVLCVRRDGAVAMAGDGQVTVGTTVMKHGAAKVRPLAKDTVQKTKSAMGLGCSPPSLL